MEVHRRSGSFFSDMTSLLLVFSAADSPVTSPISSVRVSNIGAVSYCMCH